MKKDREELGFYSFSVYRKELFAFSIISIIIFHFFDNVLEFTTDTGISLLPAKCFTSIISSIGVEIFVLLSGLGLYFSFRKNSVIKEFYTKRFVRILVPYGIFGGIAWIIITIIGGNNFWNYIYNLSLLSFWTNGNMMLWYIAFTLLVYLAFPLIFTIVNSEHSGRNTLIAVSISYLLLFACETLGTTGFLDVEIALWRIPVFIIGTYFGKLAYERQKFKPWHCVLFVIFFLQKLIYSLFVVIVDTDNISGPIFSIYDFMHKYLRFFSGLYGIGLMFLLVLIFRALNSNIISKISTPISKVTLELYMTHVTIRNISNRLGFPIGEFWYFLIYISISIIVTILLNIASDKITQRIYTKTKKTAKHYIQ